MALDGSFGSETSASAGASGTAGSALFALMSFAFVGAVLAAGMGASALWGDGGYWAVGIFAAAAVLAVRASSFICFAADDATFLAASKSAAAAAPAFWRIAVALTRVFSCSSYCVVVA